MRTHSEHVCGWVRKAESDLVTLRTMLQSGLPLDTACFHGQQAAEKYLKALLTALSHPFPFTHDLIVLNREIRRVRPNFAVSLEDLGVLTPYAVTLRYDLSFWPDRDEALDVLARAQRIRAAVLIALGETAVGLQATPDPTSE